MEKDSPKISSGIHRRPQTRAHFEESWQFPKPLLEAGAELSLRRIERGAELFDTSEKFLRAVNGFDDLEKIAQDVGLRTQRIKINSRRTLIAHSFWSDLIALV